MNSLAAGRSSRTWAGLTSLSTACCRVSIETSLTAITPWPVSVMETLLLVRKQRIKEEVKSAEQYIMQLLRVVCVFPHAKICQEPIIAFHCQDQSRFQCCGWFERGEEQHKNLPDSCQSPGHSCWRDRCSCTARKCPGRGRSWTGCNLHRTPGSTWKNTSGERQVVTKRNMSLFHCSTEIDTLQLSSKAVMEKRKRFQSVLLLTS